MTRAKGERERERQIIDLALVFLHECLYPSRPRINCNKYEEKKERRRGYKEL